MAVVCGSGKIFFILKMKKVALVLLLGFLPGILYAQTLRMNAVHRLPFPQAMSAVANGGGVTVAVGVAGSIHSSTDGLLWVRRETNIRADLQAVAWTGALFCIAGNNGTILTSTDGAVWTPRTSGTNVNLAAATSGGGLVVVAGDAGKVFTSADGITWSAASTPVVDRINGLAYGAGVFVAVTEFGGILTSSNASTWVAQPSPASGALSSVTFSSGLFVAAGAGGDVLTSPDGGVWTVRRSGEPERLWCVVPKTTGFVAAGSGGVIVQSTDGLSWSAQTLEGDPLLRAIVQAGAGLLALSEDGGLWASTNGSSWTQSSSGGVADLSAVAVGGASDPFVAVGMNGTVLISPDGFHWSPAPAPTGADLEGIAYGAFQYVAVGSGGAIYTSANGTAWTAVTSGTTKALLGITHGAAGFVAAGQAGLVLHSATGSAWTSITIPGAKGDFLAVAHGNGLYVAVGQWGQIATSPDGLAWTLLPDDPAQKERWYDITGIAYSNGLFVISTHYGTSFTSPDGTTWTKRSAAMVPGFDFHGAVALGDGFAVFGDAGAIEVSSNGTSWIAIPRVSGGRLRGAAARGNISVFVGDNGTILQGATLSRQTSWMAYHDTITQADNAANVTSGNATTDTPLTDFATGNTIPGVAIRFAQTVGTSGALKTDANAGNPTLGGDAASIFGGIIGFGSQVWDLGKNTGTATITISGLTPGKIYDLALFATRDNYSSQTKFAMGGAASFTSSHSTGYLSIGGSPTGSEVAFATGDGSTAAGRVARWSDLITSGTTLTVTVTSPDPTNNSCLLPQAIRIMEMTEDPAILAGPTSAQAVAGDSLTLTSHVLGTGVTYQWYRRDVDGNVTAVASATSAALNLANVSESAQYFVRATASGGSADSSSATVIVQRTYDQWAANKGLPPSSDALDSDGDGLPNLVEYVLGTNPGAPTAGPAMTLHEPEGLSLTFNASKDAVGVTIIPETSTTLSPDSWTSPSLVQLSDVNFATESWKASVPLTNPRAFLRLRVTRP